MPEAPNPKLREAPPPAKPAATSSLPYAELDVKSNYSFLAGASHPDELVYRAAELGYRAIAVTDFNSLAGVVRAHEAAKEAGIHLLVGTRLRFTDAPDLLVWAPDRAAYARLCRLLTLGKQRTEKGECSLALQDFLEGSEGLLAAVVEARAMENPKSEIRNSKQTQNTKEENSENAESQRLGFRHSDLGFVSDFVPQQLHELRATLKDRLSLAASCSYGSDDTTHLAQLAQLSRKSGIPLLATNDVYYHDPARRMLQDVLTCVRHGCTIREAGYKLFPNGERYLKSPEQMHRLFADYPQAIRRGIEIAQRCAFKLDELRYEYPDELSPLGKTAGEYLAELTWNGAKGRYPAGIPEKVTRLLNHELTLIGQLRFEHYFLTVYDLVTFARSRGILCQGRGSAANSAVCYCLGVTSVDPDRIDLLFERFMSAARGEPPDIDVDFEHERREEVLQYLYNKYGRDRAAMTAEVITYRGRSAVRDVGKAMGLSLDMVDSLAGKLDWWHTGVVSDEQIRETGLDPADRTIGQVMALATELLGFPRHLSQHVGGMVMTRGPLCEMVPIENASMADRTVIEWDKNDIDAIGILKVDVLALGMLTCISKAFSMIEQCGKGQWVGEGLRDKGTEGLRAGMEDPLASSFVPSSLGPSVPSSPSVTSKIGNERIVERIHHERNSKSADISGSDCLATRNVTGQNALSSHSANACIGEVSTSKSDVAGILFDPIEYCGRVRPTVTKGLPEISEDRERISLRTVDAIRFGYEPPANSASSGIEQFNRGGRSNSSSPDHESGTKDSRGKRCEEEEEMKGEETKGQRVREGQRDKGTERSSFPTLSPLVPSSLRPFPSSTLSPSVPSSLCPFVPKLELHTVPPEDPVVYDMISNADTIGVFQVESRAQMSMLPRLQPRCFYDLVIEVAIVRPGPIQGDMVHPYLRRRAKLEPVTFPSEALREVLGKTLGVPLFQEQAMRVAMVGAGFSADEADKLRRVMAAWRRTGAIETFHQKIVDGMVRNGYTLQFAEQCFNQIKGFGEYGFPESHAASFALLVYVSAWLKRHHPAAFAAALINSQPMGFYMPAQIVRDAKEHGVEVRVVDVNESEWDCTLEGGVRKGKRVGEGQRDEGTEGLRVGEGRRDEGTEGLRVGKEDLSVTLPVGPFVPLSLSPSVPSNPLPADWGKNGPAVRLGFRQLKGFRQNHAISIVDARQRAGRFASIMQFHRLTGLPVSAVRILAEADAFGSMGLCRRDALWQVMKLKDDYYPLFDGLEPVEARVELPKMPAGQEVMTDYATAGLSLKQHPVSLLREELRKRKIITAADLAKTEHNRWVKVAGLVLIRQRPGTASGVVFETLEDETGIVNLIVQPKIYDLYRPAARHARLLQAEGYVQRQGQVIHILAKRLFDLSELLEGYQLPSRDFH